MGAIQNFVLREIKSQFPEAKAKIESRANRAHGYKILTMNGCH